METPTRLRSDLSRSSITSEGTGPYSFVISDRKANATQGFPSNFIRTTKYTLLTFVPKNLFEQFRRVSNFYFLIVVIIQLIPSISPLIPITSILPLVFVLVVTAIKEALEDFSRYRADKKNNNEAFKVLRDGSLVVVPSQDIEVGEVVYIANGQHFPADFVLLSSSSDDGICYVETANLDGETNLKVRKALEATAILQDVDDLAQLSATVQCEAPNERLYRFNGRLIIDGKDKQVFSLNHTMFLQRGAQLRNTKYCYGVCVYAGVDTKLFLNQQPPPSKFSTVERVLNRFILFVFVCQLLVCLACAIGSGLFEVSTGQAAYYLGHNEYTIPVYGLRNFFTYFVLYNTMIPISLWVTLELIRVGQAKFMEWDELMGADGTDESSCKAKTSNLNEDLGRIEHIFSDKTGTLTENMMNFCKCSVRMGVFDEKNKPGGLMATLEYPTTPDDTANSIADFLRILALCHTVVSEVNPETGEITYQSQSPDETALVDTARNNGFVFVRRKADEIIIRERGVDVSYALLAVLEFSSVRRRMSVIVRTPEGKIKLLSKGADLVMFDRMIDGDRGVKDETTRNLKEFSREGYRTLVLAQREVSLDEFSEWKMAFYTANNALDNREEKVENICELIETELSLVGCSAIEDKLQDEVPETIHYLLEAGIQLWVLTGDKQETAINIGYSSRLLNPAMELIIINADNSEVCGEMMRTYLAKVEDLPLDQELEMGMVIDGHSLGFALHDHTEEFLRLGRACRSVICCRVTPLQKALVVRVVKQGEQKISLAIGDGANDVSMIQEAHVGVGIYGKEGTQAARASDYSIHQFKHLKRLLCIHGRYSYIRVAGIIQYSFYKNMSFTLGLLWFSFYNGFTGQSLYDSWIIALYNIVFTSLPPLFYGLFEKDLNEDVINQHAEVYHRMQDGELFTKFTFFVWLFGSLWHSFVVFFGTELIYSSDILYEAGKTTGLWEMGTLASTLAIFIVNLRMVLEIKTFNILLGGVIILSLAAYMLFFVVYNAAVGISVEMYYVFFNLLQSPSFYLALVILSVAALLPDFICQYYSRQYKPSDWQILREKYRRADLVELKLETFQQRSLSARGEISKFSAHADRIPTP